MNKPSPTRQADITRILAMAPEQDAAGRRRRWIAGGAIACTLAALGYAAFRFADNQPSARYLTEPAVRGKLVVTVSATGKLQPTNQVDVGSELSGTVERVLVDDNDRVRKGQALAHLDLSKLEDQVNRSKAQLAVAEAQLAQAQATVEEARANLERLEQVARLSGGKVPSKAELQTAGAAYKRAAAAEASARASIGQARAALRSDVTNLGKATIRSPIDGVVLARKVEPGQTVAASLQAPVLFTLAENLRQMKLDVDVDEADVGKVQDGQKATFQVDAHPGRSYPSSVIRTGFGAQVKEGVVSYLTVLGVDNDDLSLRPGMTATAEIVTTTRDGALLVPNAALRFAPPSPEAPRDSGGLVGRLIPRRPDFRPRRANDAVKGSAQQLWILRDGRPVAVPVTVGASDGRRTEVLKGDVQPGMEIITESVDEAK